MRSSSKLFPVRLMATELHHGFYEDSYLLKPGNSSDTSAEIAVTKLSPVDAVESTTPVVCLHGMFNNRMVWQPHRIKGFADKLLAAGYQVWLPELRGHGRSPVNYFYNDNTFEDTIAFDLPAINAFVSEQTQKKPVWIGHSLGGFAIAGALARNYIDQDTLSGMALIGAQSDKLHWILNMPLAAMISSWIVKKKPFIEGYRHGFGPENEPGRFVADILRWQAGRGWKSRDKFDYLQGLSMVSLPAFLATFGVESKDAVGDKKSRNLLDNLGSVNKSHHHFTFAKSAENFNQIDMLLGRLAEERVWPELVRWIELLQNSSARQVA